MCCEIYESEQYFLQGRAKGFSPRINRNSPVYSKNSFLLELS